MITSLLIIITQIITNLRWLLLLQKLSEKYFQRVVFSYPSHLIFWEIMDISEFLGYLFFQSCGYEMQMLSIKVNMIWHARF